MKNLIIKTLGVSATAILVFLLMLLSPLLFLWSINTLAEVAGSSFYIPHEFWSYVASFVFVMVVRGGSASSD